VGWQRNRDFPALRQVLIIETSQRLAVSWSPWPARFLVYLRGEKSGAGYFFGLAGRRLHLLWRSPPRRAGPVPGRAWKAGPLARCPGRGADHFPIDDVIFVDTTCLFH
jgi:hypothetical protein